MTGKPSSISSPERYDAIRAANPELVVNLYGMTPQGPVTLEIIAPDGAAFSWIAPTAEAAFALAFPEPGTDDERFTPFADEMVRKHAATPSIFD